MKQLITFLTILTILVAIYEGTIMAVVAACIAFSIWCSLHVYRLCYDNIYEDE